MVAFFPGAPARAHGAVSAPPKVSGDRPRMPWLIPSRLDGHPARFSRNRLPQGRVSEAPPWEEPLGDVAQSRKESGGHGIARYWRLACLESSTSRKFSLRIDCRGIN